MNFKTEAILQSSDALCTAEQHVVIANNTLKVVVIHMHESTNKRSGQLQMLS